MLLVGLFVSKKIEHQDPGGISSSSNKTMSCRRRITSLAVSGSSAGKHADWPAFVSLFAHRFNATSSNIAQSEAADDTRIFFSATGFGCITMSDSASPRSILRRRRVRLSNACYGCRVRKVKCDGSRTSTSLL